jgi:adenylate cyclase
MPGDHPSYHGCHDRAVESEPPRGSDRRGRASADWYADAGLLHRQADGNFEAQSLHRLRLIQFARRRGFSDLQLAAANSKHGDLLAIFDEFISPGDAPADLAAAAKDLGFDDDMIAEMSEILD